MNEVHVNFSLHQFHFSHIPHLFVLAYQYVPSCISRSLAQAQTQTKVKPWGETQFNDLSWYLTLSSPLFYEPRIAKNKNLIQIPDTSRYLKVFFTWRHCTIWMIHRLTCFARLEVTHPGVYQGLDTNFKPLNVWFEINRCIWGGNFGAGSSKPVKPREFMWVNSFLIAKQDPSPMMWPKCEEESSWRCQHLEDEAPIVHVEKREEKWR